METPSTPPSVPPPGNGKLVPPFPVRKISDPRELRALAHPVRFAIIDLLAEGPLTATQCAERLGETPANCSYHLRQLEKYGHVFRADGGHGRERPWRARDEGITWDEDGPAGVAARVALDEAVDEFRFDAWRRFRRRRAAEPEPWRRAALSTDVVAWLTPAELERVTQGLYDLFAPYEERDADPAARPEGARAVRLFAYAYPGGPGAGEAHR
ncbi:transcriptional regulator [Isoptericola sp. b408]|uniref:ArsR/SmtB family transcription factor n=1 Tax=Isoptericola sp. b408 TaxID=3064653 RepID=UPI0027127EDD|nr:winged helix-turn-helix domain-containing protein [Isoptericola sp. b408]MDO8152568.1 winged helix-turn-helix domain-containing protein [Isoptericola sp. b408]